MFDGQKAHDQIGANKKSLAFEVTIQSNERTKTKEIEIEDLSHKIISYVTEQTGGNLRK